VALIFAQLVDEWPSLVGIAIAGPDSGDNDEEAQRSDDPLIGVGNGEFRLRIEQR
jgi:hypothetical protein